MKNEAALMALPEIKRKLKLRLFSFLLSILFTALTITFVFGQQVTHWRWAGVFLIAGICGLLTLASSAGFLLLNKKLAGIGL